MKEKYKSLALLFKFSEKYKINFSNLKDAFIQYYDFVSNTKKKNLSKSYIIKYLLYFIYIIYLISPIHYITIYLFLFYINTFHRVKVLLNMNNSAKHHWVFFRKYKNVYNIFIDSRITKIFGKIVPIRYLKFIVLNYLYLIFDYERYKRGSIEFNDLYDLDVFSKFLNDIMYGCFLGKIRTRSILEGSAYTLNLPKYIGIKLSNPNTKVIASQFHAASSDPSMSLFQADKILSIGPKTSIHLPQFIGKRQEEVVGSRSLIYRAKKFKNNLKFNPNGKELLVLLGNTHNPKGLYYGPSHNLRYKKFLDDFIKISDQMSDWKVYFLEHPNYELNFERSYCSKSSIQFLDKNLDVYLESLNKLCC